MFHILKLWIKGIIFRLTAQRPLNNPNPAVYASTVRQSINDSYDKRTQNVTSISPVPHLVLPSQGIVDVLCDYLHSN